MHVSKSSPCRFQMDLERAAFKRKGNSLKGFIMWP